MPRRARLPLRRRFLFACVLALLLAVAAEVVSFFAFWVLQHQPFSYARLRAEQAEVRAEMQQHLAQTSAGSTAPGGTGLPAHVSAVTVHPFLGYVADSDHDVQDEFAGIGARALQFKRAPDRFTIAILGGSVAAELWGKASDVLLAQLAALPMLQGKDLRVMVLAIGGYKQPQQLMALQYALVLGCEFDLVINIDGYNEVVLARVENLPFGVSPLYPRSWNLIAGSVPDLRKFAIVGRIVQSRIRRLQWAESFAGSPATWSITFQLLWKVRDRLLDREAGSALGDLYAFEAQSREHVPYWLAGPALPEAAQEGMVQWLADLWYRCSGQLHNLCLANGARYIHFLQPNQYVPGSKPMGAAERAVALRPDDDPAAKAVVEGYPLLATAGARLRAEGVDFHDLRQLFAGIDEILYSDPCCHYNRRGNELLATRIVAEIQRALSSHR